MRKRMFLALSDVINPFVVAGKQQKTGEKNYNNFTKQKHFLTCGKQHYLQIFQVHDKQLCLFMCDVILCLLLPSDVDKEVLCCFVDVEHFIPEQTEAGRALQSQLPQRQCCGIAI